MKRLLFAILAFFTYSVLYICAVAQSTSHVLAVLNDLHVSPGNDNSVAMQQVIDEINSTDFDRVVVNGDLTNEGSDLELGYIYQALSQIRHPMLVVPGNHENNWSQSATKTFVDLWGNDRFADRVGNLVLVGMNCGPYLKMGDGHVKQEDLHWLKATLDTLVNDGDRVISFNHYPIRKDDLDNYMDYIALLEKYPVILHLNGHYHIWDQYTAGDIDAVMTRALALNDSYGYSIVEVNDSAVTIYEKLLGQEPTIKYSFVPQTRHQPKIANRHTVTESPQGFDVRCVHTDSASIFTRLAFDTERVYFGTSTGHAKAVNKLNGGLCWQQPLGNAIFGRATVLPDDKIAIPHATGIDIVDAANGLVVGNMPGSECPYVADGLLARDTLYIQGGYKRIECRNATDGHLIWSYDSIDNYCQGAPSVYQNQVVFGAWDTYLRCIDIDSGKLLWRWSNGKSNNLLSPGNVVPVINEDMVIIVAPDRYMTAIDRHTGQVIWRDNSHRYRESLGVSSDGNTVYAKTMDGELVAVESHSPIFRELWICDMGLGYEHAPCIVAESDGVIYAGSRRGLLTAVSSDTHDVLWQLELGSSEINGIDLDPYDGSVWLSLIEGTIYHVRQLSSQYDYLY